MFLEQVFDRVHGIKCLYGMPQRYKNNHSLLQHNLCYGFFFTYTIINRVQSSRRRVFVEIMTIIFFVICPVPFVSCYTLARNKSY